jgi:N-acetyl sugar amidotransferase
MTTEYKICNRCVLDTTVKDIVFNEKDICNYCTKYLNKVRGRGAIADHIDVLIGQIKKSGKGHEYDCIFGLSGGLDSTWGLKVLVDHGLRPLVVHMDNGWNSELAQNNIYNIVERLNVDLYTHVVNWVEYRDLMQSFFDADVIDIELLMDHAMVGAMYQQAGRHNIKYILTGQNMSNEGMGMPKGWNWYKYDKANIIDIWKKFGGLKKIRTYPFFGTINWLYAKYFKKIEWVRFLDYFDFDDSKAKEILIQEYGYKTYKHKHYESIFTRFFQGYILPRKFHVDKRRLHLSNIILSGQITRDEALNILDTQPYQSDVDLSQDINYITKKMGWSDSYLSEYISRLPVSHDKYKTEIHLLDFMLRVKKNLWR